MTGYGSAEGQYNGVSYTVEIKTVNNRYFKTRIKLPDMLEYLEDDIERILHKEILRGMANYTLRSKNISASALFNIDEEALKNLLGRLCNINDSMNNQCRIDISNLLNLPGVMTSASLDESKTEEFKKFVLDITQKAVEKLKQMRTTEGTALAADLEVYCKAMKDELDKIRLRQPIILQEYQKKLKKRVDSLLSEAQLEIDQETLAREVALFADKSDISEELSRLDSHLEQFSQSCKADGQAGRKLDFISQEMLREANTIASKSLDSEVVHYVVDVKCQIDRIKEQVQNIE